MHRWYKHSKTEHNQTMHLSYGISFDGYGQLSPGTIYWHGLISTPSWISNHMPSEMWGEITYPFPNCNGATVEVLEWKSNLIPHVIMDVIAETIYM